MSTALTCPDFMDGRGCGHIQPIDGDLAAARAALRNHLQGRHGGYMWTREQAERAARQAKPRSLDTARRLLAKAHRDHLAKWGR
ncbi:hypothetical protein [Streptomyces sp. NBC_00690]|uniref:hypothetical protein n=1 Tax=Streptomyces sp. NBC_00690 TaxID=2975808 RepID=UPI002E2944DD|nr:hypothetical protein [Streptomyces sp. NBC_00690]